MSDDQIQGADTYAHFMRKRCAELVKEVNDAINAIENQGHTISQEQERSFQILVESSEEAGRWEVFHTADLFLIDTTNFLLRRRAVLRRTLEGLKVIRKWRIEEDKRQSRIDSIARKKQLLAESKKTNPNFIDVDFIVTFVNEEFEQETIYIQAAELVNVDNVRYIENQSHIYPKALIE